MKWEKRRVIAGSIQVIVGVQGARPVWQSSRSFKQWNDMVLLSLTACLVESGVGLEGTGQRTGSSVRRLVEKRLGPGGRPAVGVQEGGRALKGFPR